MSNIRDVARHASVSIATVSAALNESGPVSEATRQRVWEAVKAVGYAPNGIARSLRLGRSRLIGLVVSELTNPFFGELARATETVAREQGFSVIVSNTDESEERECEVLDMLRVQRVAGIILAPAGRGEAYRSTLEQRDTMPLVTVDREVGNLARDFVGLDNLAAGRMITEYLTRLGHRRIAFIGGRPGLSNADARHAGYCAALRDAGIEPEPELAVRADFRGETAYSAVQPLLTRADRPSAIVAANNVMALGALQAISDLGFNCPADISVAGIDDFPWSTALRPRLTTVAQPIAAIGRRAAEWLLARITAGTAAPGESRRCVFTPTLLARDSCARRTGGA